MKLLKADAMWELKNYYVTRIEYGADFRYVLLRSNPSPYPSIMLNGKSYQRWTATFNPILLPSYWDNLPQTETEAWGHLPNYLKDEDIHGTV